MRRPILVAAVAALFLAPSPASAADPVDDLQRTVRRVVGTDTGGVPRVYGPVVGYVAITTLASAEPVVTLQGALADPAQWSCHVPAYDPSAPYTVTCTPLRHVVLTWECAVLHADATTHDAAALVRASMDCDGDGTPEAQATAHGDTYPGVSDRQFSPSNVVVTAFSCTADDGAGGAARPRWTVGCGDPGVPHL